MELAAMSAGILIGAAVASLAVSGWAASQIRWLAAHSRQQIAYWRNQAEQAEAAATCFATRARSADATGRAPHAGNADASKQRMDGL